MDNDFRHKSGISLRSIDLCKIDASYNSSKLDNNSKGHKFVHNDNSHKDTKWDMGLVHYNSNILVLCHICNKSDICYIFLFYVPHTNTSYHNIHNLPVKMTLFFVGFLREVIKWILDHFHFPFWIWELHSNPK